MHQAGWLAVLLVLLVHPAHCTRLAMNAQEQQAEAEANAPSYWDASRQLLQLEAARACPACVHPATVAIPTAVGTFLLTCGAWLLIQYAARRKQHWEAWGAGQSHAKRSTTDKQLQMVLTDMTRMLPDDLDRCRTNDATLCAPTSSHHATTLSSVRGISYHGRPLESNDNLILGTTDRLSLPTTAQSRALQPLASTLFSDSMSVVHPAQGIDATRQGLLLASQQHQSSSHDLEALELVATLGEGTYGRVYKANWKGIIVAVKVMELTGNERRERMAAMEAAISSSLSHPNIVQTYTFVVRPLSGTQPRHSRPSKARCMPGAPRPSSLNPRVAASGAACADHGDQERPTSQSLPGNTVPSPVPSAPSPPGRSREQLTATDNAMMTSDAGFTGTGEGRVDGHEAQYLASTGRSPQKASLSSLAVAAIFGSVRQQALNQATSGNMGSFASDAGSSQVAPLHSSGLASTSNLLPLPPASATAQQELVAGTPAAGTAAPAAAAHVQQYLEQQANAGLHNSKHLMATHDKHARQVAAAPMSVQLPAVAKARRRNGVKRAHSERNVSASAGNNLAMSMPLARGPSTLHSEDAALVGAPGDGCLTHFSGLHTCQPHLGTDAEQAGSWEIQLVQEFCEAGSLRDLLDKGGFCQAGGRIDMRALLETAMDIARALEHLHNQHIVHSDLKPRNVLLKANPLTTRGFIAKVADFGLSVRVDPNHAPHMANVFQGTLSHMAPEVLLHGQLGKPADVFAFGTVLWEMYTAERPFRGMSKGVLMDSIVKHGIRPTFPLHASQGLVSLAQQCWALSPAARPTFTEILRALQDLWQAACHGGCDEDGNVHSSMPHAMAASVVAPRRRSACIQRMPRASSAQPFHNHGHSASALPKMSLAPLHTQLMGSGRNASGPLLVPLTCTDPTQTGATTSRMGTLTSATPCSGLLTTSDQLVAVDALAMTNSALVVTTNSVGGDYVSNLDRAGSSLAPSHLHSYGSEIQVRSERTSWVQVPSLQRGSLVPSAPQSPLPSSSMQPNSRLCNMQIAYLSLVPEHASSSQAQTSGPFSQSCQQERSLLQPTQRVPSQAGTPTQPRTQLQSTAQAHADHVQLQHATATSQFQDDEEGVGSEFSGSFAMHSVVPSPAPSLMQRRSGQSLSQPGSIDTVFHCSSSNHHAVQAQGTGAGAGPTMFMYRARAAGARCNTVQEEQVEDEMMDHWSMGNTLASSEELADILFTRTATIEPPQGYHSTGFAGIVPASAGYQALVHDTLMTQISFVGSLEGEAGHIMSDGMGERMSAKSHYLEQSQSEEGLVPPSAQWSHQSSSVCDIIDGRDPATVHPMSSMQAGSHDHQQHAAHQHPHQHP